MLEIINLECVRGDQSLFHDLNLRLQPGQAIHLRGANGTGKTSLLRIISGLSLAESGEVRWQGQNIRSIRHEYTSAMLYVGHAHAVKDELTALENLNASKALSASLGRMPPEEALDRVGLYGFEHQLCRHLSAGQRRRVALARLYLSSAPLWILDEPLTAIDKIGIGEFEVLFADHVKNQGLLIFTSHQAINLGDDVLSDFDL